MMLGIVDAIMAGLGVVLEALVRYLVAPVLELALNFIVLPILRLITEIAMNVLGYVFYIIGTFILKLIDFIEILFRALAGLEANSASGMGVELHLDGRSGDILIQLIRHPDIQQAFLSMCIVGIFLLIVTTVFQVIKVEYTTEGAKNSKTPIFQKAFRGLANLMLLPLLVVFGIVFANQLLGLLDKATTVEGENPTISGLIFSTSASEAYHRKGLWAPNITKDSALTDVSNVTNGILSMITDSIGEFLPNLFNDDYWEARNAAKDYELSEAEREAVTDAFISQTEGHKYYVLANVVVYYNISDINYILMIVGGLFALKALFFSCFGMINRLYKCAMLFIISPVIIGMTPINEGGLGKWRGAFIGQVLAGYGTILAINLFFIIVRVLLKIDLDFSSTNVYGWDTTSYFTDSFMTMLFKALLVLAGCTLIEKFAKDIGGYFGADDAISSGKETAGAIGDAAMSGVKTVGMGAMAIKAVGAGVGGLASKIKNGSQYTERGVGNKAYKESMEKTKGAIDEKTGLAYKKEDRIKLANEAREKARSDFRDRGAKSDQYKKTKDNAQKYSHFDSKVKAEQSKQDAIKSKYLEEGMELKDVDITKMSKEDQEAFDASTKAMHAAAEDRDKTGMTADQAEQLEKGRKAYEEVKAESKGARFAQGARSAIFRANNLLTGAGKAGFDGMVGSKRIKELQGYEESGAKVNGGNAEMATNVAKEAREDRDKAVAGFGIGWVEAAQTAAGAALIGKEVGKELDMVGAKMVRDIAKIMENTRNNANQRYEGWEKDDDLAKERNKYLSNQHDKLQEMGLTMNWDGFEDLMNGTQEIKVTTQMVGMDGISGADLEKAIAQAMKNGGTTEAIAEAVKRVFQRVADSGNATLLKQIESIIEKKISEIKK